MPIHKVEKWCERMLPMTSYYTGVEKLAPCGTYLGFVHPATRYCHECRKAIRKENNKKCHKDTPAQQGGEHGRWGPSIVHFEGRKK